MRENRSASPINAREGGGKRPSLSNRAKAIMPSLQKSRSPQVRVSLFLFLFGGKEIPSEKTGKWVMYLIDLSDLVLRGGKGETKAMMMKFWEDAGRESGL